MTIRTTPTRGIQKRECPYCHEVIEFYAYSTWHSHLEYCRNKKEENKLIAKMTYDEKLELIEETAELTELIKGE